MVHAQHAGGPADRASDVRDLLTANRPYVIMRCVSVTVWTLCTAAALWGVPAQAGPWAREAGDLFVSFQIAAEEDPALIMEGPWEPETTLGLYAEYGLGRSLTLGADINGSEVSQMGTAFLRYTPTPPEATWQWAFDAGFGARQIGDEPAHALVRFGASVGRGFDGNEGGWPMPLRHQGGWVTLDATAFYDLEVEDVVWQAEGTLGFSLSDRTSAIFSLKAEDWPGADLLVTASPSVAFDILPETTLHIGARGALQGSNTAGVFLSLWRTF